MAAETGIGWTHGTVNFWIGCTHAGPGCEGCYAAAWAFAKWGIVFEPGGERRETKAGFNNPIRWQKMHERGERLMGGEDNQIPVPVWIFANSLSDFFDKEVPAELRKRAWAVIRRCNHLRWQLVTKRVGLVERYLPEDWNGGVGYEHVGIVATMVDQQEIDRDMEKLADLKPLGVKWIGLSIEPQLGHIMLGMWRHDLDWVITGGESKQDVYERVDGVMVKKNHKPRPYHVEWAESLIEQCAEYELPLFVKQMGDNAWDRDQPIKYKASGKDPAEWPARLRVQQMPRIYDNEMPRVLL